MLFCGGAAQMIFLGGFWSSAYVSSSSVGLNAPQIADRRSQRFQFADLGNGGGILFREHCESEKRTHWAWVLGQSRWVLLKTRWVCCGTQIKKKAACPNCGVTHEKRPTNFDKFSRLALRLRVTFFMSPHMSPSISFRVELDLDPNRLSSWRW